VSAQPRGVLTLKSMFASIKQLAKFGKIAFYTKKFEKMFEKLTLGNSEFGEYEIWYFHLYNELIACTKAS
jgi:hypothetical protein